MPLKSQRFSIFIDLVMLKNICQLIDADIMERLLFGSLAAFALGRFAADPPHALHLLSQLGNLRL